MSARRILSLALLIPVAAAAIAAAPAAAFHTHLLKSSPAANDTVAPPAAIKLWFSEKVEIGFTKVTVKDLAGIAQATGAVAYADTSADAPVVVPVTGTLAAGEYTVSWSTAAKDGHPAKGKFSFVVKAGGK
ncbi:MAG TPA: copper resistance protein CopC [Gemmatimonadaceae bacterium]|nr:copper resistance protein CopC [Gemmatimonadaceae bacterium]